MRAVRIIPGQAMQSDLVGAVLVRDLTVGGERWSKGRRLTADDLARLESLGAPPDTGPRGRTPGAPPGFTVLVLDPTDVHEDEAALRLAWVAAGSGTELRGPSESRVDMVATVDGVLHVRAEAVAHLDRIDPLQLFTLYDGQVVRRGEMVASVKVGPHAVPESILAQGIQFAARSAPLVRVAAFVPRRTGVLVKESVRPLTRERFEATVRTKVETLGSTVTGFCYVADEPLAVRGGLLSLLRGPDRADLVLTAGAASTDPTDALFVAIESLGGRVVRHGVPAHPGSMIWLARIGRADLLGLPTCGAYSKATAADLLLPSLLTGERASSALAARLGHGGVLNRSMRFRFPAYARELDDPEG